MTHFLEPMTGWLILLAFIGIGLLALYRARRRNRDVRTENEPPVEDLHPRLHAERTQAHEEHETAEHGHAAHGGSGSGALGILATVLAVVLGLVAYHEIVEPWWHGGARVSCPALRDHDAESCAFGKAGTRPVPMLATRGTDIRLSIPANVQTFYTADDGVERPWTGSPADTARFKRFWRFVCLSDRCTVAYSTS